MVLGAPPDFVTRPSIVSNIGAVFKKRPAVLVGQSPNPEADGHQPPYLFIKLYNKQMKKLLKICEIIFKFYITLGKFQRNFAANILIVMVSNSDIIVPISSFPK